MIHIVPGILKTRRFRHIRFDDSEPNRLWNFIKVRRQTAGSFLNCFLMVVHSSFHSK